MGFYENQSKIEIGSYVDVAESDSIFDCCGGKRGRVVHRHVQGGWCVSTDHFCPVNRTESELSLVPVTELAWGVFEDASEYVKNSYLHEVTEEKLREYAGRDLKAWAALHLRTHGEV